MSVFLLLSGLFCKESLVFGHHFRAAPIRNKAAIRTPRIAQRPLDPGTLNLMPIIPTIPRYGRIHFNKLGRVCDGAQIIPPPLPQMLNIVGEFYTVSLGMLFKGFHRSLIRTVCGLLLPLNIFVPSICLLIKSSITFDVLNSVFRKFRIKEITPFKINVSSLMHGARSWPFPSGFSFEGEQKNG